MTTELVQHLCFCIENAASDGGENCCQGDRGGRGGAVGTESAGCRDIMLTAENFIPRRARPLTCDTRASWVTGKAWVGVGMGLGFRLTGKARVGVGVGVGVGRNGPL